jgi:MFS family permease
MVALGTLYAWSVFVEPLERALGQSRAAVSSIFSLATVGFTIGMLVGPAFYRMTRAWTLALVACALATAGLLLSSIGGTIAVVALGYGVLFGLANGIGYGLSLQVVQAALPARRGLMTGVVVAAYTLGAAAAAPVLSAVIEAWGLAASFATLAAFLGVSGCTAFVLLRSSDAMLAPGNSADGDRGSGSTTGFVCLWLVFLLIGGAGVMSLGHAAPLAASFGGTVAEIGWAVPAVTLGNGAGRLAGGWLAERFRSGVVLASASGLNALALFTVLLAPHASTALLALAAVGLGYGCVASAMPMIVAKTYGSANVGRVYGRLFTAWGVAGLAAPFVGGLLFDAAGDYRDAVLASGIAALAAAALGAAYRERSP